MALKGSGDEADLPVRAGRGIDAGPTRAPMVGCMPSKPRIAAADAAHGVRRAPVFGVEPGGVTVDGPAVMTRLRKERDRFAAATRGAFGDLPAGTCLKGRARFAGPTRLELDTGDVVRARAIVVAAGPIRWCPRRSRPRAISF